jgi:RNase P subunit RPR2
MLTDSELRAPVPCPNCSAASGRPCRVESKRADQVVIVLRCAQCDYEWTAERLTPLFGDSRDSGTPPDDPA